MNISEMKAAIDDAKATINRADQMSTDMARILIGRLKSVQSTWVLKELKKELRNFNSQSETWKV